MHSRTVLISDLGWCQIVSLARQSRSHFVDLQRLLDLSFARLKELRARNVLLLDWKEKELVALGVGSVVDDIASRFHRAAVRSREF